MTRRAALSVCTVLAAAGFALADPPQPASGLKAGERPMPYAFVLATGPQRGQTFCYICDTADKPAVIVFARALSEPLGKLAAKLDQAVADAAAPELRSWLTLLPAGPQPGREARPVARRPRRRHADLLLHLAVQVLVRDRLLEDEHRLRLVVEHHHEVGLHFLVQLAVEDLFEERVAHRLKLHRRVRRDHAVTLQKNRPL